MKTPFWGMFVGAGLVLVSGAASAEEKKIVPGCLLSVVVAEEEELSGDQEVDANGEIHFHLGSDDEKHQVKWGVKVEGKMPKDARDLVADSLKTYLKLPDVTLTVLRYPKKSVELYGAVKTPGTYKLSLDARLSDALTASGVGTEADLSKITIMRKSAPDPQKPTAPRKVIRLLVDFTGASPEVDSDPLLSPGDRVYLAAQPVKPKEVSIPVVRVFGEVVREGAFPIKGGTVRDALMLAGGFKSTANREKIIFIRARDAKYLPLDGDKVMDNDPVHNLPVEDRDMISVEKADQSQFVSVEGEVNLPGRVPLKENEKSTLLQILEKAGGPSKSADLKKGVIRKNYFRDPSSRQVIPFNYANILKGKERNWEIETGDQIIFVRKVHTPTFFERALPVLMNFLPFGI